MKRGRRRGLCGCTTVLLILVGWAIAIAIQPRDRIEYWRTQYAELTPTADQRAATAHAIFQRIVQVAGRRAGVTPQLFITARDPWDLTLPIALRDGWIVLSRGVLDICYQDPKSGDDRLAFVLAHELAHLLNDDFWHMRFFQAVEASTTTPSPPPAFLEELRQSTSTTAHVLARELQADEQGMVYAAMAGFNTHTIVSGNHSVNFFADWIRALDPQRMKGISAANLRPTPQERATALRAYLQGVAEKTAVFYVGLWFYHAGDYPQAIRAFDLFRSVFPSREVFHNLAASHHQLALQAYQAWKKDVAVFPYQLSLALDPMTRASRIYLEGAKRGSTIDPAAQFRQHLDAAIRWYREALAQDTSYTPAALNLGAALIVRGAQATQAGLQPDFSEAVTLLSRALKQVPTSAEMLNNLGVALWYDERPERATDALTHARTLAPDYAAPVFNLATMARAAHRETDAQQYWNAYTQLAPKPALAPVAGRQHAESVDGITIGHLEASMPERWGAPLRSPVQLDGKTFTVTTYPAGVRTLARDGEILMILVEREHQGTSAQGITIGSRPHDVLTRYGQPSRRHELTGEHSWAYEVQRIAFQLRAGRVVSWLVF